MLEFPNMILNHTHEYIILLSWKFALLRCFFFRIIRGGGIPTYSINRRGKVQPYKYSPVSQGCYKNFGGERKNGREGRVHQSDYKKLWMKSFQASISGWRFLKRHCQRLMSWRAPRSVCSQFSSLWSKIKAFRDSQTRRVNRSTTSTQVLGGRPSGQGYSHGVRKQCSFVWIPRVEQSRDAAGQWTKMWASVSSSWAHRS